jgi:hypothetical protein
MRWVKNAVKVQIVKFIGHLAIMELAMCTKFRSGEIYGKIALLLQQSQVACYGLNILD